MRISRWGRSLLVSACLGVSVVSAQEAPRADDSNVGIFVRDSAVAAEKMALAERMEKAQQWDTSAEVFQEVLDGYADRVIPIHNDAQGRPDRYGSVSTVIQDRISAWPDAGKEEYRSRYELPARRLLETASGDRTVLAQVVSRYFITDAGRDAALRLIEMHFDVGEFVAAASLSDRLIDKHPSIDASQRGLLMLRSVLAWRLGGDPGRAKARADGLAREFPDAQAELGGTMRPLVDVAQAELSRTPNATASRVANDRWPGPFGAIDNAAVSAEGQLGAGQREWGKLLSFELMPTAIPAAAGPDQAQLRAMLTRPRELGAMTGVLPAVDGSQLFFQDNSRIYARDLQTGEPLPGWLKTYPGERGAYRTDGNATPAGAQMTVTLTDRYVLAIVGQADTLAAYGGMPRSGAAVVCLNRETGAVVWTRRMRDAEMRQTAPSGPTRPDAPREAMQPNFPAQPRAEDAFQSTDPAGSVLVVNDAAYFVVRGGQPGSFEDCYLVCLNLADGLPRWTRHLASGTMAMRVNAAGVFQRRDVDSHLAYADGRVFVCSDMGAVAAVEAADGSLAWLSIYPRPKPATTPQWRGFDGQNASVTPAFTGNPVMVRDGRVVVLPADAEHLFVYDALGGQEVSRVAMKWKSAEGNVAGVTDGATPQVVLNNVLAGMTDDAVVVASTQTVSLLNWKKLRDGSGEIAVADAVVRRRELRRAGFEENPIRGRPFVTDQSIYVATAWKLFRFDNRLERAREQYPQVDDWSDLADEAPGNVLVLNGNVIVAGPTRVNVYAGLDLVRARLDEAIRAQPDAVAPRLRYAEAMFNAAQFDEALKWLDAAVEKLQGRSGADADRENAFNTCVTLLRQAMRTDRMSSAVQDRVLERLERVAEGPNQIVAHRLLAAAIAQKAGENDKAVERLQSLVEDPALSQLRLRTGEEAVSVRHYAGSEIDRLLSTAGRDVYAAIEARAKQQLEAAQAAGDVQALVAVAERFPNSQTATPAILAASRALTRSLDDAKSVGQMRALRASLRQISEKLVNTPEEAVASQAVLRSYVAEGNLRAVLGRVRRLAWADSSAGVESITAQLNVRASTAGALASELQERVMSDDEAALPDLNARFDGGSFDIDHPVSVRGVSALLLPSSPRGARSDRVVALARDARSLRIYEPGSSTPLATIEVTVARMASADWMPASPDGQRNLIVRQDDRVICIDPAAGKVLWSFEVDGAASAQANAELVVDASGVVTQVLKEAAPPQQPPQPMDPAEVQIRQLQARGQINVAQAQQALIAIQARNRQLRLNGRRIGINAFQEQVIAEWIADEKPGSVQPGADLDPNRPAEDTAAVSIDAIKIASDGTVALTLTDGRLLALDGATGKVRWSEQISDRPMGSFEVVDDIVIVASTDETRSRVIALHAHDGTERLRQTIAPGQQGRVTALAVDEEGLLVVIQERAISAYDLLGIGNAPYATVKASPQNLMPTFQPNKLPGQAVLCGGRLLAFGNANAETPIVRSFELSDLQPTQVKDAPAGQIIYRQYAPVFANNRIEGTEKLWLRAHKDRVYLMTGYSLTSYPVLDDRKQMAWNRTTSDRPSLLSTQSPMLVKEGLLLVGWPRNFAGRSSRAATLELYSRQLVGDGREVGMVADEVELMHREGNIVDAFQPVNGGLYYLTTDGTLRFLKGIK